MRKRAQPPDLPLGPLIASPLEEERLPAIVRVCMVGTYLCGVTADHQLLTLAKLVTPRGRRAHRKSPEPKGARPESGDGLAAGLAE